MPHQCAHWFAMTCRRKDVCAVARTWDAMTCRRWAGVRGCRDVWREDMRKLGRCVRGKDAMTC